MLNLVSVAGVRRDVGREFGVQQCSADHSGFASIRDRRKDDRRKAFRGAKRMRIRFKINNRTSVLNARLVDPIGGHVWIRIRYRRHGRETSSPYWALRKRRGRRQSTGTSVFIMPGHEWRIFDLMRETGPQPSVRDRLASTMAPKWRCRRRSSRSRADEIHELSASRSWLPRGATFPATVQPDTFRDCENIARRQSRNIITEPRIGEPAFGKFEQQAAIDFACSLRDRRYTRVLIEFAESRRNTKSSSTTVRGWRLKSLLAKKNPATSSGAMRSACERNVWLIDAVRPNGQCRSI